MSSFRTGFWCRDLRDKVHRAGCWRRRWIIAQEIHIVQDIASTSGLARSLLGVAPWLARCQAAPHRDTVQRHPRPRRSCHIGPGKNGHDRRRPIGYMYQRRVRRAADRGGEQATIDPARDVDTAFPDLVLLTFVPGPQHTTSYIMTFMSLLRPINYVNSCF